MVRRDEEGQTSDKVPRWAPNWYQLGVNAGGLTIISCLFIWQTLRNPTPEVIQKNAADLTERLIDRTVTGLDKIVDKQDKLADKAERNITDLREIVRNRSREESVRVEALVGAMDKMIKEAEGHHKKAEESRMELSVLLKKLTAVVDKN